MPLAALLLLAVPAFAQVGFTGSGYSENFNGLGTGNTAPPAGWAFYGNLGGSNSTWTDATPGGILASGTVAMSGGTVGATLTAATTFTSSTSSNTSGFNFALPSSTGDRAMGTSPTSGSGVVLQLSLTNSTGTALNGVQVRYLIRRFTAPASVNELPGYWLFYSVANGPWTNVTALNPTVSGAGGIVVPNTTGVTTVPLTPVNFSTPWASGANLRFRWVDDNAVATSPDQIFGIDDVTIMTAQPPPVITLTAPTPGATFALPAAVALSADATDNGTVTKVEFFVGTTKIGEDLTAPFTFNWIPSLSGTYSLRAVATDDAGASAQSAPVSVSVINPNNAPPSAALTTPLAGATVPASSISVVAAASDTDGVITKVEFFSNGAKAGEDTTAPYNFTIPGIVPGPLTLTAVATDNDGASTLSDPVVLTAVAFTDSNVISRGAVWKYDDAGTDLGTAWREPGFDDALWLQGPAELGYGDAPVTALRQGPDGMTSSAKFITYYFRRTFTITDASQIIGLAATLERDDGAVIHLNGQEVARSNMPAGAVNYLTFSQTTVGGTDETTYFPLVIPPAALVSGTNVIAVEVHQRDNASSDLSFDLDLTATTIGGNALPTVTITSPAAGTPYFALATIPLLAEAADTDGSIAKVEFFNGTSKLGDATTAPYTFTWTNVPAGNYSLTTVATDNLGATRTSAPVALAVIPGPSGTLTRGPYLQKSSPVEITVRWRSSQSIAGRVRYGTSPDQLTQIADEAAAATGHSVTLTGLTPATRYYYTVGSASDALVGGTEYTFVTHPLPGAEGPIRIWALGDAGTNDSNQASVRNAFYSWTGPRIPEVVLQLGDNAYNSGTDSEFQGALFDMYPTMLRKTTFWSCLGNHETGQSTAFVDTYPYFDIYTFPTAGECGGVASGTEHYFSFDYGNVHIISLDSMTASRSPTGAMAAWLQADLASTTATWIICIFHHPSYTKGSHNSDTETELIQMRQNFNPILEAGGVDLVLNGHSHCYERSYLLDGHYGLSGTLTSAMKVDAGNGRPTGTGAYTKPLTGPRDHFGTVYCVTGSAGKATGGSLNHPAHFISLNNLGSLVLDVNGNRLDATFLRENGTTPDTYTIFKEGAADTDRDGLPDEWEIASGLQRNNPADAALDSDGDGLTNLQEFQAGTTPRSSEDSPQVASMSLQPDGSVQMHLNTVSGKLYKVEANDAFPSGPWATVADLVAGTGGSVIIADPGAVGIPSRIYRVTVLP